VVDERQMNGRLNRCEPLEEKSQRSQSRTDLSLCASGRHVGRPDEIGEFNYFDYYFSAAGTQRNPMMTVGW
jgi:hypothetical protein